MYNFSKKLLKFIETVIFLYSVKYILTKAFGGIKNVYIFGQSLDS